MSCGEGAHDFPVDRPDYFGRRPVNCIGVERGLGRCNANVFGNTIVQDALAKVVGLGLNSIGTSKLPINLVQIIREQDHAADYSFTWSNLGDVFDTSEEEEEVRINGWSITLLSEIKYGTHGRVKSGVLVKSTSPIARKGLLLGEIHEIRAGRETQSIGAGNYEKC